MAANEKSRAKVQEDRPMITIKRRDEIGFDLIETRGGKESILISEIFPIVLDQATIWLQREAGVIT